MRNFYFRSIMLVFIIIGLLSVTGCSFYPAITPVEEQHHVSIDSNIAKSDVEASKKEVHTELEELNGSLAEGSDKINSNESEVDHSVIDEEGEVNHQIEDQLDIDFEDEPIVDLTGESHSEEINSIDSEKQTGESIGKSSDVQAKDKHIALTFDDGPDLNYTPQVLDTLKEKNIKATFFIVGVQIKKFPEVVQRIVDEGHLIANHTYYHPNLNTLSKTEVLEELDKTDELIESIVGFKPRIVRPPYGAMNSDVRKIIEDSGRSVVLWNIDPRDWDSTPPDDMFANIMKNAKDEGNILFHSFGGKQIQNTVDILPKVIDALTQEGYTFVTADHFVAEHENKIEQTNNDE